MFNFSKILHDDRRNVLKWPFYIFEENFYYAQKWGE